MQTTRLLVLAGMTAMLAQVGAQSAPLTWFPGNDLNEPRSAAATVTTPSGSTMLFGGSPVGSVDVLVYGGANAQALPSTRVWPGAVALTTGQYFVFGGKQNSTNRNPVNTVLTYNPVGLIDPEYPNISNVTHMITARCDMGYASDAANFAYAIGGLGNSSNALATVERYNPALDSWTNVAALPAARYHFPAIFDGTNLIYTFGGRTNGTSGGETTTVLVYDVNANTWSTLAPMLIAVAGSGAVKGPDGKYYVVGGTSGGAVTGTVQVYDAASNSWQLSTPLPVPVTGAGAAVDAQGRLVVLGGADETGTDLSTTWVSQQLTQPDAAPVFAITTPPSATYQVPYIYTNVASGNPQPTFELLSGPDGMQIDPYSGVLTWIPAADQMGTNVVTVEASNYAGTTNRTFTINAIGPTPAVPANLRITDLEENLVTLAWDPVIPVVGTVTYTIYYREVRYSGKGQTRAYYYELASGIPTTSVIISGLAAGSSHAYSVAAVAAGSSSARSSDLGFTTLSPQPPTNLHVTGVTSTSVSLAWDPSPGPVPIVSYEVWGWLSDQITSASYASGITGTSVTITGLAPGSVHTWGVRAHDAEGNVSGFDYGPQVYNPAPTPAALTVVSPPSGVGFQFSVQPSASETTYIQATTNPADSAAWVTIATNPPAVGAFLFTDPAASLNPARFYRVVSP